MRDLWKVESARGFLSEGLGDRYGRNYGLRRVESDRLWLVIEDDFLLAAEDVSFSGRDG